MSVSRLSFALNAGLSLPAEGRILLIGAAPDLPLDGLDPARCQIVQRFYPDHATWTRRGLITLTDPDGPCSVAHVTLPRARDQAQSRVAMACAAATDLVAIEGAKSDGIDSLLKAIKQRVPILGQVAKAHGKLAWIAPTDAFADWAQGPSQRPDGVWTAPGVFSADGMDPASSALADALPHKLGARVAALGAGWGALAPAVLAREGVKECHLVEADLTALDCTRLNVTDARVTLHWADVPSWEAPAALDSVVMNPPFHVGRKADPALGQAFIASAARLLAPAGRLFMVANRHLPYESALTALFAQVDDIGGDSRFKLFAAARPRRKRH